MSATLSWIASALGVLLAVSGCAAAASPRSGPTATAAVPALLNGLSTADLVDTIHAAGLSTPNLHDVTAGKCAKLRCIGAVDSDTVSIFKFDQSGAAQRYAGTVANSYQAEDVVLIFAPTMTPPQKTAYERAVERAVA